ncbi:MAG TPA: hypothetical protein PKD37_03375 [Oligoflexia bacterium]|nr:hypothetical protein [Oligoflexia bacterium]HMP27010.1 hypothetical protein [Oligoflexia bacterium]
MIATDFWFALNLWRSPIAERQASALLEPLQQSAENTADDATTRIL